MTAAVPGLGFDRVADAGAPNPFDAWRLDPFAPLRADEVALDVDVLNLDATSFRDLMDLGGQDLSAVGPEVLRIVAERGKMHNPRTASGGVMAGVVSALGAERAGEVAVGERVVTLVSNSLVPLRLAAVLGVDPQTHQIAVKGRAVLPPYARYAAYPGDMAPALAVTLFDVCGVVPPTRQLATPGARVAVIGAAGRAGLLATVSAAEGVGPDGTVLAIVQTAQQAAAIRSLGLPAVRPFVVDATRPGELLAAIGDRLVDAVIDCANVRGTEVGCVAICREGGQVHFFNMATSFQAATLGAELIGRPMTLAIGFGLYPEAPGDALALVRRCPPLRAALSALIQLPTLPPPSP
jgi:L-erythro-3,5-diaminohexanoate dehydrogenase